jgi:hypothetical protein
MTFKEWPIHCEECDFTGKALGWDTDFPLTCPSCSSTATFLTYEAKGSSAGVIQDSIEGGLEIRHGLCNPDGSPKKYYSKTEIRRAANERGYTIGGDTPKPYRVNWSGRQRRIDGT